MNDNKDVKINELLNAAYSADEATPHFEERLVNLERFHRVSNRRPTRFTLRRGLSAVAALGLTVLTVAAWQYFTNRPGEAAIAYIPADADVVVTVDLTPSAEQAATFTKIYTAIKREGLASKFDMVATSALDKSPLAKQVRPHISNNLALAIWKEKDKSVEDNTVLFLSVKDVEAVRKALQLNAKEQENDLFKLQDGKTYAALLDQYMMLSQKPALFTKVRAVRDGGKSVAQLTEYQSARAALPKDANLMVFLSPTALAEMHDSAEKKGVGALSSTHWMALGGAIRDDGIAFDYRMPLDASNEPALRGLANAKPLSAELYRNLPAGAYGVIAYSQPGRYIAMAEMHQGKPSKGSVQTEADDFEKETGLSLMKDVMPALDGEIALAVYPGVKGNSDVDGLALATDENGADPAALAEKLRVVAEKKSGIEGRKMTFKQTQRGEATVWTLERPANVSLKDELPAPTGVEVNGHFMELDKDSKPPQMDAGFDPTSNKDLIYALVGKEVYVGSSLAIINKALDSRLGRGSTMADDPAFATMATKVMPEAEGTMMISLYRVMQAFKNGIGDDMKGSPINIDDVLMMFGGEGAGLVGSGKYDGQIATGTLFLPLDWNRTLHVLGTGANIAAPAAMGMMDENDFKEFGEAMEEMHGDRDDDDDEIVEVQTK